MGCGVEKHRTVCHTCRFGRQAARSRCSRLRILRANGTKVGSLLAPDRAHAAGLTNFSARTSRIASHAISKVAQVAGNVNDGNLMVKGARICEQMGLVGTASYSL